MLLPAKKTLKALFENSIHLYAKDIALGFVDEAPLTYGEIGMQVNSIAKALISSGIKRGDRVAILSENSPRWGVAYFSIALCGAVNVPILPDFHKNEVHHIIRNSGSKALFVSSKLVHKISETDFKDLQLIVCIDDYELDLKGYKVLRFSDLLSLPVHKKIDIKDIELKEDDLLEILYTSGTTGHSKGVMLTNKNIISNAYSALKMIDINDKDKFLSILPMSHSYECTCGFIAPFAAGAKIYYIKGLPTAQTLLPAVQVIKPTIILSVPLIMDKIYKKKVLSEINAKKVTGALYQIPAMKKLIHKIAGKKLYKAFGGNLRFMVFGGAATPIEVEQFLTEGGFPYTTGYGLTETSPILTVNPIGKVRHNSAGIIVPEVQVRIDDVDPATGIGEIVAKGPNIMQGYYRNEETTKKVFTADGWLITGDKGYFDKDGYLFIKGRSKNLIVGPSGENIYPEEIEFYLSQQPLVLESLVYEKDSRVVAKVFLDFDAIDKSYNYYEKDEAAAAKILNKILEDIRKEVNTKVAAYSRIHQLFPQREEFEKTPTKKIKRYLYTN
ncbi:MAG TPA: AMP-binding protein [bacterium]|nr:AMP-binding protein [bacterium]HPN43141.1 AMP-binding protein [bacterium]